MNDFAKILPYSVDLDQIIEKTEMHTLFLMGDKNAHRIELTVTRGGTPVDLTGCTVIGYFSSPKNQKTFQLDGKTEGNKATVTLNEQCYTLHGLFWLVIQIAGNGVEASLFCGEGFMRASRTETIVYDDYIVYDVDTLLAQISAMKQATNNANEAAVAANEAASHAPYVGENGNWHAWDVGLKKYVDTGEVAAGPKGDNGDTPYIGSNGNWWIGNTDTGTPARGPQGPNGTGAGTVTGVMVNGETYEPDDSGVVDLGNLGGGTGDGTVTGVMVNGETYEPDETGVVDLGELGGTNPSYAAHPINRLVNGNFKNPVNQSGANYYSGADNLMTIDRWIIDKSVAQVLLEDGIVIDNTNSISDSCLSETLPIDEDGTYTFAVMANESLAYIVFTLESGLVTTGNSKAFTNGFLSVKKVDGFMNLGIVVHAQASIKCEWAAVYEGVYNEDTMPQYVQKGYGNELADCQKLMYYVPTKAMFRATSVSVGTMDFFVPIPIMRTSPEFNSNVLVVQSMSFAQQSGFTFVNQGQLKQFAFRIRATKSNHGLSDGFLYVNNAPLILSADYVSAKHRGENNDGYDTIV